MVVFSGWDKLREEKASYSSHSAKWKHMQNKKRLVRKVKKQCFVYWNMLKNLNKWRSKANYSASIIQSLSRQYLARAIYLEKYELLV